MLRKEMIDKLVESDSILMTSGELKEFDWETFDWIRGRLQQFVINEAATEEDLDLFDNGEYLCEQVFGEGGCRYYAGRTEQDIANQPPWGEDSWKDWETEDIEQYYNELESTE